MIDKIEIENFKGINELSLELSNLNLITGVNSCGKSSVLQTLLLLRQSYYKGNFSSQRKRNSLFLGDRDSLVKLGVFRDVFHENAEENAAIKMAISINEQMLSFTSDAFNSGGKDVDLKDSINILGSLEPKLLPTIWNWGDVSVFSPNFQYLSADRIAPKESYPNPAEQDGFLGKQGEFAPHFLEKYGNEPIPIKALIHEKTTRPKEQDTLSWQLNYWLSDISNNIEVYVQPNNITNQTELWYRYNSNGISGSDRKPQNVGYGITPILPIIIALLAAQPDDLILIENPEVHLNPIAQASLAQLIARTAQEGVQIIVETHSDHFVNGTLVATKKHENKQQGIDKEKVCLYHFSKGEKAETIATRILLVGDGKIGNQPDGFFEQYDKDLETIMGF